MALQGIGKIMKVWKTFLIINLEIREIPRSFSGILRHFCIVTILIMKKIVVFPSIRSFRGEYLIWLSIYSGI